MVLVASRLLVHALGLAPNPATIIDHWQHIDLRLLAADPLGSLWALHTQPPLWNAILACAVALVGPDSAAVTGVMFGLNVILTAGAGLMILSVLRQLGFSTRAATVFAALAICSPSVFYFENYIFYPHFTFFMITLLLWLLARVRRDGPLWPIASALGVLTALSWTWAIFHPAFIAAAGVALVVWRHGWTIKSAARPVIALAALAFGISCLPAVKNLALHGVPSASTWIGLNLAQTIPGGQSDDLAHCDFVTAQREAVAAHPGLPTDHPLLTQAWKSPGHANFAHAGMIETSKRCMELTTRVILGDPLGWLASRLQAIAGSHQLSPSNYDADPDGWAGVFGPMESAMDALGVFGRSTMTLWYLVLIWVGAKSIRSNPPLYLSLLGVIAYFTLASHLLNGNEQARMRYTIEPIYLFFSAGLVLALYRRYGAGLRPLGRGSEAASGERLTAP